MSEREPCPRCGKGRRKADHLCPHGLVCVREPPCPECDLLAWVEKVIAAMVLRFAADAGSWTEADREFWRGMGRLQSVAELARNCRAARERR